MAAPSSKFVTLSPNVAQTVTVRRHGAHYVAVCLFQGSSEVYFRVDGTGATVLGDDCEGIPAIAGAELVVISDDTNGEIDVSVISPGAVTVLVRAVA